MRAWAGRWGPVAVGTAFGGAVLLAARYPFPRDTAGLMACALAVAMTLVVREWVSLKRRSQLLAVELGDALEEVRSAEEELSRVHHLMAMGARRFEQLFQGIPVACLTVDLDGTIQDWNRAAEDLWSFNPVDTYHQPLTDVLRSCQEGDCADIFAKLLHESQPVRDLARTFNTATGPQEVQINAFPLTSASGETIGAVITFTDIRELVSIQRQLRASEERLRTLFETLPVGLTLNTLDGQFVQANPALLEMLGYSPEELQLLTWHELTPTDYREQEAEKVRNLIAHGQFGPYEKEYIRKDGSRVPIVCHGVVLADEQDDYLVWSSVVDISDRKAAERVISQHLAQAQQTSIELLQANASLFRMASRDPLTGILNRGSLDRMLATEFRSARELGTDLGLILIDVDRFKSLNDRFGHLAGDDVLRTIATLLANGAPSPCVVARYGGEEFALLAPGYDRESTVALADQLRRSVLASRFSVGTVTISCGVTVLDPEIQSVEDLIEQADFALYSAKNHGRNQVA